MDPTATLEAMIDAVEAQEFDEAREYAGYLLNWLANGGFPPRGCQKRETRELCEKVRRSAETVTAEELCIGE